MVSLQETINKQGEDLRALARENVTLRVLVVENENLKRTLEMQTTHLMQLEEEVKECKHSFVDLNALKECMSKVEYDHVLKEKKFDTMSQDVYDMKNVRTNKPRDDVCGNNVVSNSSLMQAMAQTKNVENVDVEELKEWEKHSKDIVI
ncbi:hypothetical protein DD594_26665, partial [Enterobacter cloacae complex sp. 4DZ1-17B1]